MGMAMRMRAATAPIWRTWRWTPSRGSCGRWERWGFRRAIRCSAVIATCGRWQPTPPSPGTTIWRSEEHTSELQSLMRISYAVFCLKKKKKKNRKYYTVTKTKNTQHKKLYRKKNEHYKAQIR